MHNCCLPGSRSLVRFQIDLGTIMYVLFDGIWNYGRKKCRPLHTLESHVCTNSFSTTAESASYSLPCYLANLRLCLESLVFTLK